MTAGQTTHGNFGKTNNKHATMTSNVSPEKRKYLQEIPGSNSPLELVEFIKEPVKFLTDRFNRHGEIFRTRIVYPVIIMLGPECNRVIHVSQREKFSYEKGYGKISFGQIFERSIVLVDGDEWQDMRNLLTPAVTRLGIRESCLKVNEIWKMHTGHLDDGIARDAYYFVQPITYHVSATALTGIELGDELEELRPHFERLIDGALQSIPYRIPFSPLDRALQSRDFLRERLYPKVDEARKQEDPPGMFGLLAKHRDEDGNYLSHEEVIRHVLLLFWAGYDTTASAGSWCVHLLAHTPEWQRQLREEAFEVLGDRDFELADVGKLKKLTWFIQEQERHRPSINVFARETVEDVQFKNYIIPEGTQIMYSPYMSHHIPWVFDNPNLFDPGRWDPARGEEQAKKSNLIGFGGGPRLCIGRNFALMQLRVLITWLLRNYVIEPDERESFTRQELPMHRPVNSKVYFRRLG